jgi:hypothetical protein
MPKRLGTKTISEHHSSCEGLCAAKLLNAHLAGAFLVAIMVKKTEAEHEY